MHASCDKDLNLLSVYNNPGIWAIFQRYVILVNKPTEQQNI